jgi:hypothetical protein
MIECDLCGRSKLKSLSGYTRHREVCRRKILEQNQRRKQLANSHRQSLAGEEHAATNPRQVVEPPENGDEHTLEKLSRDATPEPMFQSFTDEYAVTRPRQSAELSEDAEFEPITPEDLGRDPSPEQIDRQGSWI